MSGLILPQSMVAQQAQAKVEQHIDKLAADKAHNITFQTREELRSKRTLIKMAEDILQEVNVYYDSRGVVKENQELCVRYAKLGKDFDAILKAIENNPTLQSEWTRFCMMLRLAQE